MSSRALVKPEVMSPAGYWPQLRAAVEAGADSVYLGLKHFTARAKVGFTLEELPEVMASLHERGVKGFVTFNTLIFEHELSEAARAIASIARAGADAIIIQDAGAMKLAHTIAPELEIHASTQMSITDAAGVRFAQSLGARRVTLARELSLEEIARIRRETDCDLEIFVHGALCVAYSGQCFSSEAWGGRSANRGQCAQACRLPYEMVVDGTVEPLADARYLLSPGDLYALKLIPEIMQIGISTLKIEGRYKDAEYVALTTRAYRNAVDQAWAAQPLTISPREELQLEQIYSRGLGPHFLKGTDHQAVVQGRAPRHRGVLVGTVISADRNGVAISLSEAASQSPLKPGDGLVFDSASWRSPEEREEGGRIFEVHLARPGKVTLLFGNNAIDPSRIRRGDLVWRTHDPEVERAAKPYLEPATPVRKQKLRVHVIARERQPLLTRWSLLDQPSRVIEVQSPQPLDTASSRALSLEYLQEQLGRLGGTQYVLSDIDFDIEGSPFAPASILNGIRRAAVDKLIAAQRELTQREVVNPIDALEKLCATSPTESRPFAMHLLVRSPDQLDAAIESQPASITLDYLDLYGLRPSVDRVKAAGIETRVASPRILKPGEEKIADFLLRLECGILVRSTGLLDRLSAAGGRRLIGDFSLNAANSVTARLLLDRGLEKLTPTYDLNAEQIADLARLAGAHHIEAVAFGHLPVFHTEHCVFARFLSTGTSYKDCGRPCEKHRVELRDPSGRSHPVVADVGCRNTVFGAQAQEASSHLDNWRTVGVRDYRLEFVHESPRQVRAVVEAFRRWIDDGDSAALAHKWRKAAPGGATEGSLFVTKDYLSLPILQ